METNVNSFSTWGWLVQQADFDRIRIPEGKTPQIYFICRRPKISFDPKSVRKNGSVYEVDLVSLRGGGKDSIEIEPHEGSGVLRVEFDSKPPHTHIYFVDELGNTESCNIAAAVAHAESVPEHYLDLEILYIGQSVGTSSGYNIIERLKNHSTLQKIYAEAIRSSPDYDIWVALFHFDYQQVYMFNGPTLADGKLSFETQVEPDANAEDEMLKMEEIDSSPKLRQQYINFTEAALIRYFEPEYNQKFKDTFPSPAHSSYASCYDLDVHSVSVGFVGDSIHARVFTSKVKPAKVHGINFELQNSEERKNLFSLLATSEDLMKDKEKGGV